MNNEPKWTYVNVYKGSVDEHPVDTIRPAAVEAEIVRMRGPDRGAYEVLVDCDSLKVGHNWHIDSLHIWVRNE